MVSNLLVEFNHLYDPYLIVFKFYQDFPCLAYYALSKKSPYSELFWSAFSRIQTEYGEIRSIFPYSDRMRENADQKNIEHGHF